MDRQTAAWFDSLPEEIRRYMLFLPYSLRGSSLRYLPDKMEWDTTFRRGDVREGIRDWIRRNRFNEVACQWWNHLDNETRASIQRWPRQPMDPCSFGWPVPHPLLAPASCWPAEELKFDAEYLDDDTLEWVLSLSGGQLSPQNTTGYSCNF